MLLTILLAKVLGLYMLIAGIAVLLRKREFLLAIGAFVEDKSTRLIAALFTLLVGLFLVNLHNDWSTLPSSLITLFGWIATIKGIAYLVLKETTLEKLVKYFYNRKWFLIDGIISVLLGLYLAGFGYGWF
jgi:uncharacterized membrane protein HdeD (DUF308 family)